MIYANIASTTVEILIAVFIEGTIATAALLPPLVPSLNSVAITALGCHKGFFFLTGSFLGNVQHS